MSSRSVLTRAAPAFAAVAIALAAPGARAGCDKCSVYIGEASPTSQVVNACGDTLVEASAPINCIDPTNVVTGTAFDMTNLTHLVAMHMESVTLTVTGLCVHGNTHSRSVTVDLVHPPPGCGGATCGGAPGTLTMDADNSIRGRITLGPAAVSGGYGGHIELYANALPDSGYHTPAALRIKGGVGLDVVRSGYPDPQISQIMAPECFVRVEPEDGYRYHISYYHRDNVYYSETLGMYVFLGEPRLIVRHTVENPDGTNAFARLRFSEERAGQVRTNEFAWAQAPGGPVQWGIAEGGGARHRALHVEDSGEETVKTWTVGSPSAGDASVKRTVYAQRGGLTVPVRAIADPGGAALTTFYEYTDSGELRLTVNPDGSWDRPLYSGGGLVSERRSGWLDAGTNAAEEATQVTAYEYSPFLSQVGTIARYAATGDTVYVYFEVVTNLWPDTGATDRGTPRAETVTAAGVPVAKTLRVIHTDTMGYKTVEVVRLADPSAADHAGAYADPANPRTVRTYMPRSDAPWSERPETARHPDGRTEAWEYVAGTYDAGGDGAPGTFTENSLGAFVRVTLTRATADAPDGTAFRTTRETTVETLTGRVLQTETHLYDGGDYQLISWRKNTLNDLGQVVATAGSDGTLAETEWGCCGPAFETAADGTVTDTAYDALRRPILSTRLGDGARPDIFTETAYDAAGRVTFRRASSGGISQSATNAYDLAGRLTWSRGPDGVETHYSYGSNSTATVRGGLTNLSVRFADGRAHYTEQNGVRRQTHAYGVNADGTQWTLSARGELPAGLGSTLELPNFSTLELLDFPWEIGIADPLGRTVAQIRPGYSGALLVTSNAYNTAGRLVRTSTLSASAPLRETLFTYDDFGEPLLTCEDLDLDGEIDLSGPDRVSGRATRYVQLSGDWWRESASWTYPGDGSAAPLTNAVSRTRITGLGTAFSADGATGLLTAESVSIDARGNETVSRTVIDRGNKTVYQLTQTPGSSVAALSTTVNGLLVSSRSASGLVATYAYDALGRMTASQDARGAVHSRGYDEFGRVAWESDPATNGTWYAYDDLGRRTAATNALGDVTWTAYDPEGRAIATWGATYPVAYEYDGQGRMSAMYTYRGTNEIASQSEIENLKSQMDRTTWSYDQPTGILTNKVYADGKGTAYTYTPDGKLASRTWARGVTASYAYTNGSSLTAIDYSDDTPDVAFAYDHLGRMTSAIVAGVSTNTYAYDPETLALSVETQNGVEITRTTDALGRDTGFSLAGSDYAVQYAYDAYGRFHSVSSSVQSVQSVAAYSYLEDSDLISGMTVSSGFLWSRAYESRSLITSVENSFGETEISRYDYQNDELGRRTAISRSGQAFGDLPVQDVYGYNLRSEVTSARRTPVGSQTELRGFSYDYAFDPIGNRITSTEYDHEDNALVSSYTANAINQYGQRTVPGYAGVRGEADTNATVTVNADPAWRWGGYFYGGDEADNSADAVMKELEITATYSNLFTSVTGRVFVAETPESFTYDDDGNLTQDGRFEYTWNGENRLIKAETRDDLPAAVPRMKVEYAYDHQSRRIASATAVWTNDAWQAVESRAFLYDGWNVIRETVAVGSGSPQTVSTNLYTWGIDLSGSLQGAGGIGGLLAASLHGTTALYCYDANGNVGQLVSPDGDLLAHYEYSPFGETIIFTGPLAKANPFRFSTKHWDDVTGLGYWGHRWYSPGMGSWPSRDTIGEQGGLNLYGFVANYPIGFVDPVGFSVWDWGIWPWNWFRRCDPDYEFDNRGWSYGDTWTPGTVGGDVIIVGPDGTERISLPPVRYSGEYGLTKTAIEQVGYNCCCEDNAGGYSPTFLLKVSTETWILNRDADPWGNDDASFRDPRVDDYWRSSWQWWRRRMVRWHERRHRQHAEDNYEKIRDTLQSEEDTSYDSKSDCLEAAIRALRRALREFQMNERRDRERAERGEL